jgi:hypothetical protein
MRPSVNADQSRTRSAQCRLTRGEANKYNRIGEARKPSPNQARELLLSSHNIS